MGPLILLLIGLLACRATSDEEPLVDPSLEPIAAYDPLIFVDPFIATGGVGAEIASVSPGATRPFGMVYVGPDTRSSYGAPGFYHCAGYHWEDTHISAFSHTHAQGMGVTDYGGIAVMPQVGWRDDFTSDEGRQLEFSHDDEWAYPSSYGVRLNTIDVAISATQRGAIHEYKFEEGEPTLIVDLAHALGTDDVRASDLAFDVENGVIRGYQNLHGSYSTRFGGLRTWFYAEVEPKPTTVGVWSSDTDIQAGVATVDGVGVGGWLGFPDGTEQVTLRLGISYVDAEGAERNFEEELRGLQRSQVAKAGEEAWRDELSSVRVRGADEASRRIFHSSLYRASIMPSQFDDVDGRYRGIDGNVHTTEHPYYSDFSLWDTFRTLHPWLTLANRDRQADMLRSLVQMHRDGGALPRWPMAHGYTGGMIGTPADQVLAEGWLKGIRGWDADYAFEAAVENSQQTVAFASRSGLQSYLSQGYVSADETGQSVSKTLEYAWSDHALAEWEMPWDGAR